MSKKHFRAKFGWGARMALTALALAGVVALAGCSPGLTGGSEEFELSGTVESVGSDALVVDGQTVVLTSSTKMPKDIAVGDAVRLTLGQTDNGQSFALEIEVLEDAENGNQNLNENEDDEANENEAFNENNEDDDNGNEDDDDNENEALNANEDDDTESEFVGTLESIDPGQLTVVIDGKSYPLASNAEIKDNPQPGDLVKVHLMGLSDGTVVVREIERADSDDDDDDNENAALNANEDDDDDNGNEAFNENEDDGDDESNENAALNANEDDDDDNGNEAFNGDEDDEDDKGNDRGDDHEDDDHDDDDDSGDHDDDDGGDD